jgi:ParB-like chromosome segregation protein Spo0J
VLIAGHGRVAAAAKLRLTIPIPVIVARGWSEDEKQAYRLADNELAARGSFAVARASVSGADLPLLRDQ